MFEQTRESLLPWINTGVGANSTLAQLYGLPTYKWTPTPSPTPAGQGGAPQSMLPAMPVYSAGSGGGADFGGGGDPGGWVYPGGMLPGMGQPPGQNPGGQAGGRWEMTPGTGKPDFSAFTTSPDYQFAEAEGRRALERSAAARGGLISGNQLRAAQTFGQGLATQQFGNYWNRLLQLSTMGQNAAAGVGANATQAAGQIGNSLMAAGQAQAAGAVGAANAITGGIGGGLRSLNQLGASGFDLFGGGSSSYASPGLFSGMSGTGGLYG